ncbi:MAG TPA: asparagine synthetase B, partial [Candidatus Eisenbacteria bacterium]|nr:asparagine synthetase B [Candidatus Eisenbacteria bacterium]
MTCIPDRPKRVGLLGILLILIMGAVPASARILIPMDLTQTDHLRAYGIAYWILTRGQTVEWLLNYRGGSFLLEDDPEILAEARIRGVLVEEIDEGAASAIQAEIEGSNMESILLEKAPRVAIYIPPGFVPWDDAVTLAFAYAQIPYTAIWDEEVLRGELDNYDWLHLHHEDFTGQYGKFYGSFRNADWYREQVAREEAQAERLGFSKVSEEKKQVTILIRDWVAVGGFLFAMCSATDTFDIALAARKVDICAPMFDGDAPDPNASGKLDFTQTLAF